MNRPRGTAVRSGYWCECTISTIGSEQSPVPVASFDAGSAAEAVIGVIVAIEMTMTDQDRKEATAAREWFDKSQTTWSLIGGQACTYAVTRGDMEINWTLRPVLFLPLTHRSRSQLPACAKRFTTYPLPHQAHRPGTE